MMFLSKGWAARLCAVMACCVLSASAARAALVGPDFQIGPNVSLDSLAVATSGANYLVVWRDLSGGPNAAQISGSMVSSTGVASASFAISNVLGMPQLAPVQRARVAYNSTNFLVVWHDLRPNGTGVRGAFVTPQGTLVGAGDFLIANTVSAQNVNPQVSFSGGNFFIAWQDTPLSGTGTQIFYTSITSGGFIYPVQSVPPLNPGIVAQHLEFLIPNFNGEILVVYQDTISSPNATYAVRVEPDNSISGPASGTKMFTNDFLPGGAGAPIGGTYFADTQEYMLLAQLDSRISCAVSRAWLKPDGRISLSTAPFTLAGQGAPGLEENSYPLAIFNSADRGPLTIDPKTGKPDTVIHQPGEFLFLRNGKVTDVAYHIFAKRVNVDGTDSDPLMAVVDEASSGILNGATAATIGTQYFVVWMDGRRRVTDPPFQTNIYGAMIDGTVIGNTLRPYLRPGGIIVPQVGVAPLTITVGPGTSTGIPDSGLWDFGDGSATTNLLSTTHKYANAGSYLAVFSLLKSGLMYNQFFHIDVESSDVGGAGGPPQSIGGVIRPSTAGIDTQVVLSGLAGTLNFAKTGADAVRLVGKFDVTRVPLYLKGQPCQITIGTNTYSFALLADGTFASASGTTPITTFQLAPFTGSFVFNSTSDKLLAALSGSGVDNSTQTKLPVSIPISVSFAGMSTTQTIQAEYTSKVGVSGKINYVIGTTGATGDGYFGTSAGFATERLTAGKKGLMIHDFGVAGNLTLPGSKPLVKPATGIWRVTFGNYSQDIPVGAVTLTGTTYSFQPKHITSGVTQFLYNQKTGSYALSLKGIPATGESASGMALSTNQVTRADMAVSVDFDLDGGVKFQSSAFLRLFRKDVTKLKWALR